MNSEGESVVCFLLVNRVPCFNFLLEMVKPKPFFLSGINI